MRSSLILFACLYPCSRGIWAMPNNCSNARVDTGEIDIDCGGTSCPPCKSGDSCFADTDCDNSTTCKLHMDNSTGICVGAAAARDSSLEIAIVAVLGSITSKEIQLKAQMYALQAILLIVLASAILFVRGSSLIHVWLLFILVILLSIPLWILELVLRIELLPGLPLSALMFLTPAVVACSLTWRIHGRAATSALVQRGLLDWRNVTRHVWHVVSVGLMPLLLLGSYGIAVAADLALPEEKLVVWEELPLLLLLFYFAALCEEIAWFGFAFEPLREQFGFFSASLMIGAFWALWHFVPYVQVQSADNLPWVLGQSLFSTLFRVLLAWLYEMTNHSVFDAALCHASYNTAWQLFPNRGSGYDPWVMTVLVAVVLLIVVTVSHTRRGQVAFASVSAKRERLNEF